MAKERSEIQEAHTWDLSTIFATDEAWEKELEHVKQSVEKSGERFSGHLLDSAQSLKRLRNYMFMPL